LGQRKIHFANQIDNLLDRIGVADVDQHPLVAIVDQIDIRADDMAGLMIDFDDVGKKGLPFQHGFPCIVERFTGWFQESSRQQRILRAMGSFYKPRAPAPAATRRSICSGLDSHRPQYL
jgi:hypothetical protein